MSGYTLTYKTGRSPALVDGSLLRPDMLGLLDRAALGAMPLPIGRTLLPLGGMFDIEGEPGPRLTLAGLPVVDRLGAGMANGELVVEGDAGDDLGASMTGGVIRVKGHAGHRAGGPDHASRRGMTGGEILIDANAGDYAGFLMRRGLIAIAGTTGKSPGYRMLAGTLVVQRGTLDHPGLEMQRGTILCLDDNNSPESPPTPVGGFGPHITPDSLIAAGAIPAMLLVMRRLDQLRWPHNDAPMTARIATGSWRIHTGDRFALHNGEVLQWQA